MYPTLALAVLILFNTSPSYAQSLRNPVLPGDFPDPSVIRVGNDYWATATTSEWAPHFPLLHSRDLINWKQVGTVFSTLPDWAVANFWSPEIAQHRGRFFIYYAARKKDGPLCVAVASASRPDGPYKDHGPLVCQPLGSIDPFPVTAENGRRYLLWKEDGNSGGKPTPIWAQQLSADGTRLVGTPHELIRNTTSWEAQLVEGAAVVRRNGWFYLFYSGNACCGRDCNYALGVARSRKLLGPWEKNPANPILVANDRWKCPGHGTVVSDKRGRFFYLYHAYDSKDFVYVGRQGLLDAISWTRDGWPTINDGKGPAGTSSVAIVNDFVDDFRLAQLAQGWQWPVSGKPQIDIREGWLTLKSATPAAVLARQTTTGNYVATTAIDIQGMRVTDSAGLSAFGDAANALGISVDGKKAISLWRREKNEEKREPVVFPIITNVVYLRITARNGSNFSFAVSNDDKSWTTIGNEMNGSYLPPWDRGVRVALIVQGSPAATGRFDFLRITPTR